MAVDGWAPILLGSACKKIGSGATPRGGGDVYLDDGPYALIRSQNVYNEGFRSEGLAFIGEKHARELNNVAVEKDDVLLNITGDSVARCCQVDPSILPARVNQHVAIVRPDPERLNPRFLRYLLVSPEIQARLLSWAGSGGTRNALTKGMIGSLEVLAPRDLAEQTAIAYILGTLDEKIELNRQMSETQESLARALFKSWFVDCDPVQAKAEGRAVGVPKAIADLFPSTFVDSEEGMVPDGWRIEPLDGIAHFLNGLALQKYPPGDGSALPVIKIAQIRKGDTVGADRCGTEVPANYVVDDGDVLFSWSGSLECVVWTGGKGALNQHLFKVTSSHYPKWFYYWAVHEHLPDFRAVAAGKATTMGHIQRHDLTDAKVLVPDAETLTAADRMISPLFEQALGLRVESRTLGALRDALLAKLISGDLRVTDAERIVRNAI